MNREYSGIFLIISKFKIQNYHCFINFAESDFCHSIFMIQQWNVLS